MFEYLKPFPTIVVTGPQRSGTRIATRMIASDLRLEYIQEDAFNVHDFAFFWGFLSRPAVIHAPALSACCHLLPRHVGVVFMRRRIEDIRKSQSGTIMPDGKAWIEQREFVELAKYFREGGQSAEVKYEMWTRFQKPTMRASGKGCFDLNYDDLQAHPLWIPKEQRRGWQPTQTAPLPLTV